MLIFSVFFLQSSNTRKCVYSYTSYGCQRIHQDSGGFSSKKGGAEIISIDAVNRSVIQEDFIIGITIIKKDDATGQQSHFFNVYSDWDLNSDSALEVVSQNCLPLELDFVPYHLYHIKTKGKNGWETVWLLSGSDCCIHIYHSDDESHSYQEVDCSESFPEFTNMTDITLWMDISYSSDNKQRVSATCGEGGIVHMFCVNVESKPLVTASRTVLWDYPSASVKIFDLKTVLPIPRYLQGVHRLQEKALRREPEAPAYIVVGNTLESCIVYRDFVSCQSGYRLPESNANDVVTCCIVCDIDQDGKNEILVGTYGQTVIVYKLREEEEPSTWDIHHRITVPCPVLSLAYCDVMGDGSFQLIVMTTTGIHIFQHNPWEVASVILSRLEALTETEADFIPTGAEVKAS
ncbi:KICSTOR complex protein kaptin-like isoform X2 [Homarus americanus]|uniref:KICSTOR complex protein kaptin-like isoform X2 n=1 Tax=Homarus americanus TaxID=6706 RepID=UPI001C4509F8|nr:KICSTOR complex protein kaptin-like isoform X2 [Homarus americanus]XP_042238144.1 KICSTOR complex protein kaptin-like isoform X2 [Homarus americanus]XP_042238146.1 KICSTOR complex protein kaptin-like isoform X2 [Homarus americanus]XP_042238147.1 KICSTOR complex protein kaptin-like isoform X2 [Homarus americanus]